MNESTINPCKTMRNGLAEIAKGNQKGVWLWYVRQHVKKCKRCQEALDALESYLKMTTDYSHNSQEPPSNKFISNLQDKLDEIDQSHDE